jgi:hypothetical protein
MHVIQLEPYDDVTSVRDRLTTIESDKVLLVFPRGDTPILRRKLDLVLIQREAARRGLQVALVTNDADVIDHAAELNMSTFENIKGGKSTEWRTPRNKVFISREDRPVDAPDAYELAPVASRLRPLTPREIAIKRGTRIALALGFAVILIVTAIIVLPGADVVITPAQSQINTSLELLADTSLNAVDIDNGLIPAQIIELDVEADASIPTTGFDDVPATLASGTVVFSNRTNSDIPVPAGTVVFSTGVDPARFRTLAPITVPAGIGNTATITIQALDDSAGVLGNIEPNLIINIEGDLGGLVQVRNPEPTRGGSIREQSIVTREDFTNIVTLARERLRQAAVAQFTARLTGTQFIVPDSIVIINEGNEQVTYSAFVGDPAATLTVQIRGRVRAMIIDEQFAREAARAALARQVGARERLVLESIAFTRSDASLLEGGTTASLRIAATGSIAAFIDAERVRQTIAGIGVTDAQGILDRTWILDPRTPPQITVYPSIFGRLPFLSTRINVTIREAAS